MVKLWERDPSLLLMPNIPQPLHGVNPRTVLGDLWWNRERKQAYASTNRHCEACGVHGDDARPKKGLEAHEVYLIDYDLGTSTYFKTVPLCQMCHQFIHSGRLRYLLEQGTITKNRYASVIKHGDLVLENAGYAEDVIWLRDKKLYEKIISNQVAEWGTWRLVIDLSQYRMEVLNQHKDKIDKRTSVYVGRGSQWGNPYHIDKEKNTRDVVCDKFEKYQLPKLNLMPLFLKDLVCFCKPQRCHGDSILNALYRTLKFKPQYGSVEER